MQGESAERDLLAAARAVELRLISPEQLAKAIAQWRTAGTGSLLACLEGLSDLDDAKRLQLRRLFDELCNSVASEIAESIDDSIFGKLNDALGDAEVDEPQVNAPRWQNLLSARPLEPPTEADRFHIIATHAKGGLGEVLLAEDRQLNRNVALKRIREKWAGNEYANVRFRQEAEITGRLEHPGVVPVYALGRRGDGEIFYAMRFIRGNSLEAAVAEFHQSNCGESDRFQSPEFRDLLRRFIDVCNTISYAHSRGIIHRDLKPANIMLGRYGETLVVDWGLAKPVGVEEDASYAGLESLITSDSGSGSAPTQFGSAIGTPQYMSPEQATGRLNLMGPATDVFGLGATLYHLLVNQPPQPNDSVDRILDRVEHGEYPPAHTVNDRVPRQLAAVCDKAMSVRPSERYSDPQKLAADIERWLADEPTSVYQDPIRARTARWVRKNQTLAATTAAAMVLLIIVSFLGSFVWHRLERQKFEFAQAAAASQAKAHEESVVRNARLQSSLARTEEIVATQLADAHFKAAVSVLNREINTLKDQPEFEAQRKGLQVKADRVRRIAEFHRLFAIAEEARLLSKDEDEIIAVFQGLNQLGVWDRADWWNGLPDEDLDAEQRFQLREKAYRTLVLVASTYTKLTGKRTLKRFGSEIPQTLSGKFDAIFSPDGKEEARATLAICQLANRYRYSECLEWYRGIAGFRLLKSMMVPSRKLDQPRNPADAYEISILLLTSALTEDFPFKDYLGVADSMLHARELLGTASRLDPDHYFTNLVLGQTEFLIGERAAANGDPEAWKHYELSQHAYGRCLAIDPALPFAYAEVSSVCLREKEVMTASRELTPEDVTRNQRELLRRCVDSSLKAVDRAPASAWVYWHYGHALAAADRMDAAMEAYRRAVTMTYRFTEDSNESLIDMDRLRGRKRLIDETQLRIDGGEDRSVFHALIAAAHLIPGDIESARPFAAAARQIEPVDSLAWSTSGIIALHDDDVATAFEYFEKGLNARRNSFWAAHGKALCLERQELTAQSLSEFEHAETLAVAKHHKAEALLGQCRILITLGHSEQAGEVMRAARNIYPACRLREVEVLATKLNDTVALEVVQELRHISTSDIVSNQQIRSTSTVCIHNHDFELPPGRSWSNPGAPAWHVNGEGISVAKIETEGPGDQKNHVLHITTHLKEGEVYARTRQTISVEHDTNYVLSFRANSAHAENGSLEVHITADGAMPKTPVATVATSDNKWRTITGTFLSPRLRRNHGLMPMTLWIVSRAPADLRIDDLKISRQQDAAAAVVQQVGSDSQ